MYRISIRTLLFLMFLCSITMVYGQVNTQSFISSLEGVSAEGNLEKGYYLIHTDNIATFEAKYHLKKIKRYPNNFYVSYSNDNWQPSPQEITKVYTLRDTWKLSPDLKYRYIHQELPKTKIQVSVKVINQKNFKREWITIAPKTRIISIFQDHFLLEIPVKDFDKLLKHESVLHIGPSGTPHVETEVIANDLSVNAISNVHHLYPELNGDGFTVSIKELLFDTNDIDFKNRFFLTGLEADEVDQHAALIGTVIGGAGNTSNKGLGVANAITLTSSSFLRIFPDPDAIFQDNNISVQNHSYGTSLEPEYGNEAAAYDQNIKNNPSLVHVFSSGNSGNLTPEFGPYAGIPNFSNQTGNFKAAKNIISVGAINREGEIDLRSSRGPAPDGRVKPELVAYAPGGTSDAAALVSGVTVLLQNAYQNTTGQLPSSPLVKAALIAGAESLGVSEINFESGYGNLNGLNSTNVILEQQLFEETIIENETKTFEINIPEAISRLKVALVWNDIAANPGDEIALINDLDMEIHSNSETWLPWVLNSFPNIDSLRLPALRKRDTLNNVELITIDKPVAGNYTISVSGSAVSTLNQAFSIAYHLVPENTFNWLFPTATDALENETENLIRWKNTLPETTGILQVRINQGEWETLVNQLSLDSSFFRWNTPDVNGIVQFRLLAGGITYPGEPFTIGKKVEPKVLFNCDSELLLGWSNIPEATSYDVLFLGDRNLEIAQNVTDTTIVLQKSEFDNSFFSVRPVFEGLSGIQGTTINTDLQGVDCYFRTFIAFLTETNLVSASLNLSTAINVASVVFSKTIDGVTTEVERFNAPFQDLEFTISDSQLIPGTNVYDVTIFLEDGTSIKTDPISLFIPFEDTLILFPNPVNSGGLLNIVSSGDNRTYEIVELSGRVVSKGDIFSINDFIDINLIPGLYIFRTLIDGKTMEVGKIIVN